MKLIMLPCAGGNSFMFQQLSASISTFISPYSFDYPGHGRRIELALSNSLNDIVNDFFSEMSKMNLFDGEPYALMGYSMGSLVCYEVVQRIIEKKLHLPEHLFICASATKGMEATEEVYAYSREELSIYLKELGGTSAELLENKEFQDFYFPIIKADLTAINRYKANISNKLSVPATILYGSKDQYSEREMYQWSNYIEFCSFEKIEGGHFFINEAHEKIKEIIQNILKV